ncbi:MAG: protein BatD [Saprospiraceae bacterium]|nr:protein BatD [Saprospiraceae bacterium]
MRITLITILFLHTLLITAQQVSFTAQVDAKQVVAGGSFTVTFTLQNAEGEAFQAPEFPNSQVISGPSQSFRSTFINGRSSTSVGYSYTLLATQEGTIKIGPASIQVKGKTLRTNPIQIQVVKARDPAASNEDVQAPDIFIRAEVDAGQAYIGQQIVIWYKIYTQINIENYNILSESSYDGCYSQVLDAFREPVVKEVINGVQYSTKVLRKVAVFPQQSGKIEFEPLVVRIGIPDKARRRSFFSSFSLKTRNLSSDGITLFVKSAYDGALGNFSGAVGHFKPSFTLSKDQITTDDALTLRLQLVGNGDVKTVRPPGLVLPKGLDQYDPKTIDEKMINGNDSIRGVKTIEYLLTAEQPGRYEIKPAFTHFDPRKRVYITHKDSFSILVSKGMHPNQVSGDQERSQSGQELAPLMLSTNSRRTGSIWVTKPWYWLIALAPLLGIVAFYFHTKHKIKEQTPLADPRNMAHIRLAKAKELMKAGKAGEFYEEIAFSVKQFIGSKLDIPNAELSKESIIATLAQYAQYEKLTELVSDLLQRCDFAIYAGGNESERMVSTYGQAVRIIDQLDKDP